MEARWPGDCPVPREDLCVLIPMLRWLVLEHQPAGQREVGAFFAAFSAVRSLGPMFVENAIKGDADHRGEVANNSKEW